jgi:hypothetical protein
MATILNRTTTFATNGTVTAAGLHNLIDDTSIYAGLITTQTNLASVGTGDKLLIAQASGADTSSPFSTTVLNLFDDALTGGTYTNLNLSESLTYGTATGNRTVSTSATITTGTIPNLTSSTANITLGTIPTLTAGTTTSTAANITNGTVQALTASTGTIGTFNSTTGTIATLNSTTGTIGNLSTTLAGDFTISQGTGTLGTTGATLGTYGGATSIPVLAINAKGQVTSTGTAALTAGYTGFRNRIINGDMRIDQRNAGSAVTVGTGTVGYTLDRFFAYQNSPSTLVQASRNTSAPSGFQNSIKLGRNGSGVAGLVVFGQALETANSIDAQGGTVTLSFYAKAGANFSAASSQIGVTLYSGTDTDQSALSMVTSAWTGTATPISSTATLTTSWQRFTFTSTSLGASVSQLGMTLNWTNVGAAGADDNVYITGMQLETGSNATDFERRPIGTELALCQRYYLKKAALAINGLALAGNAPVTNVQQDFPDTFPTMRSSPVASISAASHFTIYVNAATRAATNLQASNTSPSSAWWISQNNNIGASVALTLYASNASAFLAYSSEL